MIRFPRTMLTTSGVVPAVRPSTTRCRIDHTYPDAGAVSGALSPPINSTPPVALPVISGSRTGLVAFSRASTCASCLLSDWSSSDWFSRLSLAPARISTSATGGTGLPDFLREQVGQRPAGQLRHDDR